MPVLTKYITAEWAIARIQAEARHNSRSLQIIESSTQKSGGIKHGSMAKTADTNHNTDNDGNRDPKFSQPFKGARPFKNDHFTDHDERGHFNVGQYRCMSCDHLGSLYVTSLGLRFVTKIRSHELWRMNFDQLKNMRKVGDFLIYIYGIKFHFV